MNPRIIEISELKRLLELRLNQANGRYFLSMTFEIYPRLSDEQPTHVHLAGSLFEIEADESTAKTDKLDK